ncbi:ubiquitin carboxyl-terminal hydrolase family protein [Stylonychia lemnae]|uniref:Ubiquitin carboxyl-terminal hydrolase family protein n=1 Tax=Stylonychia lemnae TaxID=5949 RepID=A0A078ABI6_STYLE|nr:ubiquitin carboxyl-terminal hydrolase family protein [Stylonychia lemnae]|eukprot:CDW78148.1 ubiquitin carboxyl-terminal hydrolase family protein [Stylonychia lemnae]
MQTHINISDQAQDDTKQIDETKQEDLAMIDTTIHPDQPEVEMEAIEASLVETLKQQSLLIQTAIDKKEEPADILDQINKMLSKRYEQIWNELFNEESDSVSRRSEFYKVVFKQSADKFLSTKSIQNPEYLALILKFFRNILVNFFPRDVGAEILAEIVHSLFNLEAPLYTLALQSSKKRQINQSEQPHILSIDDDDLSVDQRRIKREYQWRSQLKEGDRLDVIYRKQITNHRISQWQKASVIQVLEDDKLYVSFLNDMPLNNSLVSRYGPEIAEPDTFTDDMEWRFAIQKGDLFDGLDGETIWYKSTCLDTRRFSIGPAPGDPNVVNRYINEIYVGYRYYDEDEGHKWDDDGRKFVGWSNRYDEWISVTSPTIQRLNTLVKQYTNVSKAQMIYDTVIDDISDVIYNCKDIKVWAVFRNNFFSNLSSIPDYLNEFGAKGGYDKILEFLMSQNIERVKLFALIFIQTISLKHIQLILDFLSKTQTLWHRQFMCKFIPLLREAAEYAVLHRDNKNGGALQQKFTKESLLGVQKALQGVIRRYYTQEKYAQLMAEFNFNIGFQLLRSEKLEQRILGIKEIIDQIKNTKFAARKMISSKDVMKKLKTDNVFEQIFGENYHIQLIQRSQEIIKFYINEKEITEVEIDQIWQATKRDQQTKMEIYKIIQEVAIMFKQDEVEMLVQRFSEVPPDQFVEKEIECVYELAKYSYKQQTFSVRAAKLFWDIAVQERPYKKQIIEIAMEKFIDLIRNWDREQKGEFIAKCIAKIKNHQSTVQSIKIVQKILDQIPNYRVNNLPTLFDMANQLIKQEDIINLVIYDFIYYNDIVNDLWSKNILNEGNIDTIDILDIPFSHRAQSFTRLNFVRQMLQNSNTQLDQMQLDQIWDLMLVRSKISIDSDIFFNWFKQLLSDQSKLSPELILNFFQTKMCGADVSFKYIKKAGFDCILQIFLKINEQDDRIHLISLPTYNSSAAIQTKLDFKVHVPPKDLIGIDLLWKLLAQCDKKNSDLTAAVIDLITKVYHNLSSGLEEKKHEIEDQFCRECLQKLHDIIVNPEVIEDDKKQIIKIITVMMKSFFNDSERNGTGNMRPHSGLSRGKLTEKLIIQNNITNMKATPRYIEVNVNSNMTVWQLKKLIAEKLKQSPLRIQLNRIDAKKRAPTDQDHQTLLRDLRFEPYEILHAAKKPITYQAKTTLINKKKELVPLAREIFASWFKKFSTADGFMTPDTCVEFIRNSTNDPSVLMTDPRVVRLFNEYDKDIDGKLTEEEFLEFYKDRSIQKPDLVWSNLQTHGIGNDLKPQSSQNQTEDPNEIRDPQALPRFKLSKDQDIFNEIFNLMDKCGSGSQSELWILIGNLRTNPLIYAKLLSLSSISELVEDTSAYKLLYNLQILEQFIDQYSIQESQNIKCYFVENQEYNSQFPLLDAQNNNSNQNSQNVQSDNLNEQKRDVQNAAPQSGIAIPLPPQDQSNVPIPPSQGIFIGPIAPSNAGQNLNNTLTKNKEMLENFKGHIITEPYEDKIISDEEIAQILEISNVEEVIEMRQNWIQSFVLNNGFSVLCIFLKNLMESNVPNGILQNPQDRECLNQVLKTMKLLILSTFMGSAQSSEITLDLQKNLSQPAKIEEDVDIDIMEILEKLEPTTISATQIPFLSQTNNTANGTSSAGPQLLKRDTIQADQDNIGKQFEPLINILRGELGQRILDSMNFSEFQQQILMIVKAIVCKDKIVNDDKSNVESALQLWISVILYNPELLQQIYDDFDKNNKSSIVGTIIEKGLLCNNFSVRDCIKEGFKFLYTKVNTPNLSEAPYIFFLRIMIQNVQLVEYKSRESKQFFMVLRDLFEVYYDAEAKQRPDFKQIINARELAQEFVVKLNTYESKEKKNTYLEDTNLVGFLNMLNTLVKNNPDCLEQTEYIGISEYLIEKCLFTFKLEPLEKHITKEVDIPAFEKPFINKCLTTDSRIACYNLIQTMCRLQPKIIGGLISKYLHPLLYIIQKPKKSGFAPRSETRSFHGFCGIRNLGCICYMNAMIQQFYHIPTFRYCLLATQDNQPINLQEFENEKVDDNMLHQLMKFMGFLELSERQDYNPREFCFSFKDFAGQPTNVRIQQDSQEFLNLAFDRLERLLANTSQKYLLQNIFGGQTCSLMICKNCGNLRQMKENFYNLSLEVKNQKSIYDGLKKFITGEIINDFLCEACNQKVDVERKTVIEKLPNMLIVHLQRIVFDYDTFQNAKLNSRVEFPNVLNLKPYMLSEVMKQEKELLKQARKDKKKKEKEIEKEIGQNKKKEEQVKIEEGKIEEGSDEIQLDKMEIIGNSPTKNEKDASSDDENDQPDIMEIDAPEEDYQYKLVGVVVHMGTADAGHYISYINITRGVKNEETPEWLLTEKENWLEFNDSTVKDYRFANLEEDCYGGGSSSNSGNFQNSDMKNDYSRNAYMLIYEKRRKEKIKIVIPEQIVQQSQSSSSLDCDGTAISRDLSQHHLFYVVPQLQENLLNNNINQVLFYDESSKEHYSLVEFNSAKKFVPNEIYKMVQRDNYLFLTEKSIFNNNFFETTKILVDTLIQNAPEVLQDSESNQNQLLFDFLRRLIFDLLSMTTENKQLLEMTKLLLRMIDLNDAQLLKIVDEQILLDKSKLGKDQKSFLESLLTNMDKDMREMNQLILTSVVNRLFAINRIDVVDSIMNQIFAMIPEDFYKNWLKLHQILQFLFDVTKSGHAQMSYMVEHKLISKLIDFYMENDSPLVGNKKRQVMGSNYAQPPLDNLILIISIILRNYKRVILESDNQESFNGQSMLYMAMFPEELPPLSDEDIFMLNQKAFWSKNMKAGYQRVEFGRLIAQMSFFNLQFSRKVAKRLVIGLNKASADEVEPYLYVVQSLLLLNDPYKQFRLEWILGIPQLKVDKTMIYNQDVSIINTKLGVQILDSASDDVYEYRSTLFKQSTNTRQSFLQLVYQFRRSWSKYTFQLLMSLLQGCQQDPTGYLLHYIKTLEPSNYCNARYIDWIGPFIEDQFENMKKFPTTTSQQEYIMVVQLKAILDALFYPQKQIPQPTSEQVQVDVQIESLQQDKPQEQMESIQSSNQQDTIINTSLNKPSIISYDSTDGGPEQYIIWDVIEEKIIKDHIMFDENIQITVKEYTVRITESKPDGLTNKVFTPDQFQQLGRGRNNDNQSNVGINNQPRRRKYGRGAGNYDVQQKGSHTVMLAQKRNPLKRGAGQKKKRNHNKDKGQPLEFQQNFQGGNQQDADTVIIDDGEENQNQDDSMDVEYQDDNHGDDYYPENENSQGAREYYNYGTTQIAPQDNFQDPTNQVYDPQEENRIYQDGNNQIDQDYEKQNKGVVPGMTTFKDENQYSTLKQDSEPYVTENNQDQQQIQEENTEFHVNQNQNENQLATDAWEAAVSCVLVFSVTNLDKSKPQTVTLTLMNSSQVNDPPINFRIPASPIPALLMGSKERDIAVFTKLRPFEDWGNYQYYIQVVQPKNSDGGANAVNHARVGIAPIIQTNSNVSGPIMIDSNVGVGYDEIMDAEMGGTGAADYKECPTCTFHNLTLLSFCEVCGSSL